MGYSKIRTTFLCFCFGDLVFTIQRQVFDFLGYLWIPILVNFLNIIFIIFGVFGAIQRVNKYVLTFCIWSILWLFWNIFLILFYLNIGSLNRESGVLSLGTGGSSWWETNGWGCQPKWGEADDVAGAADGSWLRPLRVDGCLLPWVRVEVGQAGAALLLTAIATAAAIALLLSLSKDNAQDGNSPKSTLQRPLYTIELSKPPPTMHEATLKPMTPRRVKRRSISRGPGGSSRRSRRSHTSSHHNVAYQGSSASFTNLSEIRPTSAHSSYSNYHGVRPASYHCEQVQQASYRCDAIPPTSYEPAPPPAAYGYEQAPPSVYSYEPSPTQSPVPPVGYVTRAMAQAPHRPPPAPPSVVSNGGPPAYHLHYSGVDNNLS